MADAGEDGARSRCVRALCPAATTFDGVAGLRRALLARPDVFVGTMTEKLLTYALGRGVDDRDAPPSRQIRREAARDNYRVLVARRRRSSGAHRFR